MEAAASDPDEIIDLMGMQIEEVRDMSQDSGEEEDSVEIFEPINMPPSLPSVLVLNQAYLTALQEFRQTLIDRLDRNRERQQELLNEEKQVPVTAKKKEVAVSADATGSSNPLSMIVFKAPYFKDVKGLHPPANPDVVRRRELGLVNQALIDVPKPFTKTELEKLESVIREHGLRKLLHRHVRQKEALIGDISFIQNSPSEDPEDDERKIEMKRSNISKLNEEIAVLSAGYTFPSLSESESLDWMSISVQLDSCHTDTECMLKWINEQHPHINVSPFTPEEVEKIKELVPAKDNDFDAVADELSSPGRIRRAWQVASYYQCNLNQDIKKSGPLSKAEALLLEVVVGHCRIGNFIPWQQVKSFMIGRTVPQLKHFWSKKNCIKMGDPWNEFEDMVLAVAVRKFGTPHWNRVAHYVYGRTNRQCRERYALRLAINDRKIGSWTREEDMEIIKAAERHEFKWALVEKEIPHRNARQIAQRYALLMERMKHTGNWAASTSRDETNQSFKRKANSTIQKLKDITDSDDKMTAFLNESREKLKQSYESRHGGQPQEEDDSEFPINEAAAVDQQICEIFSFYSSVTGRKALDRGGQDQQVYISARDSLTDLLKGRKLKATNPFTSVVERIFTDEVTSTLGNGTPAVLPPNRTTLRALQGLLLQRDYLIKKVTDAGISKDQIGEMCPKTPEYERLSQIFKAIFFWPAVCSVTDAPTKPEEPVRLFRTPQEVKEWKRERATVLSRERDKQIMLLQSASGTTELATCFNRVRQNPTSVLDVKEFERVAYSQDSAPSKRSKKPIRKERVKKPVILNGQARKRPPSTPEPRLEPERRSKRTPKPKNFAE